MNIPFFKKRLKVKDVMSVELVKVSQKTTLQQAAKKMAEFRIGNVLVVENNKLKGMLTEMDIVRRAIAKNKGPKTVVKDVMVSPVIFVSPEDEIMHVSDKMLMNNMTRMPVVDLKEKTVVGIITMKDILRVLPGFLIERIEWLRVHPVGEEKQIPKVKGVCEVCGKFTDKLRFSKGVWICEDCD